MQSLLLLLIGLLLIVVAVNVDTYQTCADPDRFTIAVRRDATDVIASWSTREPSRYYLTITEPDDIIDALNSAFTCNNGVHSVEHPHILQVCDRAFINGSGGIMKSHSGAQFGLCLSTDTITDSTTVTCLQQAGPRLPATAHTVRLDSPASSSSLKIRTEWQCGSEFFPRKMREIREIELHAV